MCIFNNVVLGSLTYIRSSSYLYHRILGGLFWIDRTDVYDNLCNLFLHYSEKSLVANGLCSHIKCKLLPVSTLRVSNIILLNIPLVTKQ